MADRNDLNDKVIEAAWKDDAFRAQLLADPKAALLQLNIPVPAGVTVKVHEETVNVVHVVIPRNPAKTKLSDEELDAVAGGGGMDSWWPWDPNFC